VQIVRNTVHLQVTAAVESTFHHYVGNGAVRMFLSILKIVRMI